MNRNKPMIQVVVPGILTFLLSVFFVLGCSAPLPDRLAEGKAWQATCSSSKMEATDVRADASATAVMDEVGGDFEVLLRDAAARTAVCGGRLSVRAFAGSSAGTVVLFDETLRLDGATENARFLRIKGVQDDVVDEVTENYEHLSGLRGGSDIVGQFRLSGEFAEQLGPDYELTTVVYTDAMQNIGPVDPTQAYDAMTAEQLADQVTVPVLSGADVTVVGVGNVNGVKAPTSVAEALVRFYTALCHRMDAGRCTVASDYVSPVGR